MVSAVEGLKVVASFGSYNPVLPVTMVILSILFLVQPFGSSKLGIVFAPTVIIWFLFIGLIGLYSICLAPRVLYAFNPAYIVTWFQRNNEAGWSALGDVVLCFTGAEALYADVGFFGTKAVSTSFVLFVYPWILCSYVGQAAYVLTAPSDISNSFYGSVPSYLVWPMVIVATAATLVASQAILSASFSLASQAVSVGALPRLKIVHISDTLAGQVYVPTVNWGMAV